MLSSGKAPDITHDGTSDRYAKLERLVLAAACRLHSMRLYTVAIDDCCVHAYHA